MGKLYLFCLICSEHLMADWLSEKSRKFPFKTRSNIVQYSFQFAFVFLNASDGVLKEKFWITLIRLGFLRVVFSGETPTSYFKRNYSNINITLCRCYRTVPSAIWEIFSEFFIFCNLFHEPLGEWNNSKIWETRKIFANIARGNVR